ncbi:N-acetyltransferase [bacterium]|nr:MAG: N-acetyltransferase [bacterium]
MLIEANDHDFETLIGGGVPAGLKLPPGGVETPEVLGMLRLLANPIRQSIGHAAWMIVENEEIVGLLSITKTLPTSGAAEIGYGVAPSRRGRGVCSRAVRDFLCWAENHPLIREVLVETAVDNLPSQKVLEHNSFSRVGERLDEEDGPLFCWKFVLSNPLTFATDF